jgi:hypothetical protein
MTMDMNMDMNMNNFIIYRFFFDFIVYLKKIFVVEKSKISSSLGFISFLEKGVDCFQGFGAFFFVVFSVFSYLFLMSRWCTCLKQLTLLDGSVDGTRSSRQYAKQHPKQKDDR